MGRVWTPWTLFLLVFTTNLLTNFDSGALPAVLNQLRASPQYTPTASTPDVAPSAPPAVPAQPEPVLASAKQGRAPRAPKPSRHPARRLDQTFERNFDPWSPTGVADAGADGTETQRGKCTSGCHGFSLGYFELGVLGALPYIALSVVSPFVGALLQRARVRRVLLLAVVVNGAACLLFGLATSAWLLQVTRFGVGLSQAFAVIYFPVWTDAKAPPESKTFYMSMMQAGVPLGIVCGYLVGGLLTSFLDTEHSLVAGWRLPFLLQGAVLIPLGLAFATVPEAMLEVSPDALPLASPSRVRSDAHSSSFAAAAAGGGAAARKGGDGSPHQSVYAMASELWRSPVYMYVLLCLTSIFFIVSGIQYWVTIFLTDHFGMDEATVVLSFTIVSATGPLLGVLAGGWLVDRAGGYSNHPRCLRVLANYTVIGVALAAGIALVENAVIVIVLIWLLLVIGGAVLAPATGVLLTAVPVHVRTFASAISMMAYNLLGYCLAPLLAGGVIEVYGVHWGFRLVVSWVVFSCLFLFLAICAADGAEQSALVDEECVDDEVTGEPVLGGLKAYAVAKARRQAAASATSAPAAEPAPGTSFRLSRMADGSFSIEAAGSGSVLGGPPGAGRISAIERTL